MRRVAGLGQGVTLFTRQATAARILESRDRVGKGGLALTEGLGVSCLGIVGQQCGTKKPEHLQGCQIGGRFDRHGRARINKQLCNQVNTLLRSGQHQHLFRRAGQADLKQVLGDALTQVPIALARAILQNPRRHVVQTEFRKTLYGGQPSSKGNHARPVDHGQDFADR